jgi:hypothetical protein
MGSEMLLLGVWSLVSLVTLIIGITGIRRTRKPALALLFTYFIAQPFAWTLLVIANGGGSIILPIPDVIAIGLFFAGIVEYEVVEGSISICFPPSPLSTLIVFAIVFFIARRSTWVAYHHFFRKSAGDH